MSSNKNPLVSVIIPTYNRAKLVSRAVESVLAQTYKNIEVIVIDNGSTDETVSLLAPKLKQIIFIMESHKGVSRARNIGIKQSKGEFLAFLDSDDEWLPDKIERQLLLFRNPNVLSVYCNAYYVDDKGDILLIKKGRYRGNILRHLLTDNVVSGSASAIILRRSCFDKVAAFREDLETREDWDLWLRLAFHFYFDYVPVPLVKIRVHSGNISNTQLTENSRQAIQAIYDGLLANPDYEFYLRRHWRECKATIRHYSGIVYVRNNKLIKAHKEFIRAIVLSPFRARSYYALLKTLLGVRMTNLLKKVQYYRLNRRF
jgi:glycosyltransferase involved in cell wall biosynthesis